MRNWFIVLACGLLLAGATAQIQKVQQVAPATATPPELVATYSNLADTILASKATEASLVRSIVSMTYRHAEGMYGRAVAKLKTGTDAKAEVETLAALVAQLGNEGDSAVAGIRKRLLEGGHHHNSAGEEQGIYDDGFVLVTRKARKELLSAAGEIGRMASKQNAEALAGAWERVGTICAALMK